MLRNRNVKKMHSDWILFASSIYNNAVSSLQRCYVVVTKTFFWKDMYLHTKQRCQKSKRNAYFSSFYILHVVVIRHIHLPMCKVNSICATAGSSIKKNSLYIKMSEKNYCYCNSASSGIFV